MVGRMWAWERETDRERAHCHCIQLYGIYSSKSNRQIGISIWKTCYEYQIHFKSLLGSRIARSRSLRPERTKKKVISLKIDILIYFSCLFPSYLTTVSAHTSRQASKLASNRSTQWNAVCLALPNGIRQVHSHFRNLYSIKWDDFHWNHLTNLETLQVDDAYLNVKLLKFIWTFSMRLSIL